MKKIKREGVKKMADKNPDSKKEQMYEFDWNDEDKKIFDILIKSMPKDMAVNEVNKLKGKTERVKDAKKREDILIKQMDVVKTSIHKLIQEKKINPPMKIAIEITDEGVVNIGVRTKFGLGLHKVPMILTSPDGKKYQCESAKAGARKLFELLKKEGDLTPQEMDRFKYELDEANVAWTTQILKWAELGGYSAVKK